MVALQKSAGITAEDMGNLVEAFDTMGVGVEGAVSSVDDLADKARGLGLNVGAFLSTTAKNLKLVNSYGFKDGVEGLTRMVARAQALRIDMTSVKGLAADLLNPEKAIELAAEFQNLGGAFAGLGDAYQLMNLGQNDMEGLQNAIIDATKASVQFNSQTKSFEISALEMRRLRAVAEATGLDYEKIADTAKLAAKETRAFEDIKFLDVDSDKKQLIANLAKLNKDGKLEIQLPNMEKAVELTELNAKQVKDAYDQLKTQQDEGELTALDVAKQQRSTLEDILDTLRTPAGKLAANIAAGENYEKATQNARNLADQVKEGLEEVMTEENYESISNLLTQKISNALQTIDFSSFEALGESVGDLAEQQIKKVFLKMKEVLLVEGASTTNLVPVLAPTPNTLPFDNMSPNTNTTASVNVENMEVVHKGTVEIKGLQETFNLASLSQSQLQELGTKIKSAMGSQFLATG
jgi:hypothetical protein